MILGRIGKGYCKTKQGVRIFGQDFWLGCFSAFNVDIFKAIMIRSRMRNRFLEHKSDENTLISETKKQVCITSVKSLKRIFLINEYK